MDGQEEAAICLGEVSDSGEEENGGWLTAGRVKRTTRSWELGGAGVPRGREKLFVP